MQYIFPDIALNKNHIESRALHFVNYGSCTSSITLKKITRNAKINQLLITHTALNQRMFSS